MADLSLTAKLGLVATRALPDDRLPQQWQRIEALHRCKQFLRRYREALRAWTSSLTTLLFPPGTYQMARRYAVPIAPT